jgi:hypothetical protein
MTPSINTDTIDLIISHEYITVVFHDTCYHKTYWKENSRPPKESDLRSCNKPKPTVESRSRRRKRSTLQLNY